MLAEYSYTNNEAPEEKEFAEFTETGEYGFPEAISERNRTV